MWLLRQPLLLSQPLLRLPGHYLLFILKDFPPQPDPPKGLVSSVAKIVQIAKLKSIAVTRANPTIQTGKTRQFTATSQ